MDQANTYEGARARLADDAEWTSSFGYPGEGGYCEHWRRPNGERWRISNGRWDALKPFTWTLTPCEP